MKNWCNIQEIIYQLLLPCKTRINVVTSSGTITCEFIFDQRSKEPNVVEILLKNRLIYLNNLHGGKGYLVSICWLKNLGDLYT